MPHRTSPRQNRRQNQRPISEPSSPQQVQDGRKFLEAGDVCVGCIVWLPRQKNLAGPTLHCIQSDCDEVLNAGGYNHPVVVLGVRQSQASRAIGDIVVRVAVVTTFGDTPLSRYDPNSSGGRRPCSSVPIIDPADQDGQNDWIALCSEYQGHNALTLLHLENQRTLCKQSYVRLDHVYEAPLFMLRTYDLVGYRAYHWRLDRTSYRLLMGLLDLKPEVYQPTHNIWETAPTRLQKLAEPRAVLVQVPVPGSHSDVAGAQVQRPYPSATAPRDLSTAQAIPQQSSRLSNPLPPTRQTQYSNPRTNFDALSELPVPATHTPRRQNGWFSFGIIVSFLFSLIVTGRRIWSRITTMC